MPKRQARHDGRGAAQEAQRKERATKKRLKGARLSMYVSDEAGAQLEALAAYRGTSKTEII